MKKRKLRLEHLLFLLAFSIIIGCNKNEEISFYKDPRDGQIYDTIRVGEQTWFAKNLNFKKNDSWWIDNSSSNGDIYGRLYTWNSALTACPDGWHLPDDNEWKILEINLGMSNEDADGVGSRGVDVGKILKSVVGWYSEGNGSNDIGFTALPAGYRDRNSGGFYFSPGYGFWWTATVSDSTKAYMRSVNYKGPKISRYHEYNNTGFSVRCVKD